MRIIPPKEGETPSDKICHFVLEEDGLSVLMSRPEADEPFHIHGEVELSVIQFFFSTEGNFTFSFGPHYKMELTEGRNFFFYNPEKLMQFEISGPSHGKLVAMFVSIKKLHALFSDSASDLPFLASDNINRRFYDDREISTGVLLSLHQLFSVDLGENAQRIFTKAKVYEILALYFSHREADLESCPFLNDEENVKKIKQAKEKLISHMNNPPTIAELSKAVGINEYRLKTGFKEIYGNTIYGFLIDHKMEQARHMLDSGHYQVNEVAYNIGYTNPSHFITAFKKKFGITPKKYLQKK